MAYQKIKDLLTTTELNREVTAQGWVRSERGNKFVKFIHLNDGSTIKNIQVVADVAKFPEEVLKLITTGACISATGILVASQGKGQAQEIQATAIEILGECDPENYPLQKRGQDSKEKKPVTLPLEFLREKAHLRPRTNTFGAVLRMRHHMTFGIHKFFNDRGFYNLHSPIITGSDAEGAGEMFRVTTLPIKDIPLINAELTEISKKYRGILFDFFKERNIDVKNLNALLKEISKKENLSKTYDLSDFILATVGELKELKKLAKIVKRYPSITEYFNKLYDELIRGGFFEIKENTVYFGKRFDQIYSVKNDIPITRRYGPENYPYLILSFFNFKRFENKLRRDRKSQVDFSQDFFGKETNLTVSGQLEGELAALALGSIYTFGPTFRAENSNTPRHLAEFWMIEPEVAFNDINDNMNLAEDMLKYLIRYALEHCHDDLQFLNDTYDDKLIARLHSVIEKPFARISYTEGIDVLLAAISKGKKFEFKVAWGEDLAKEHENYLVEHFGGPVVVTGYPKEIKSFYMKLNDDGKTVRAMDILFPWIGEIIGGSQREDNYAKLAQRIKECHIPDESVWWYLETRKFGSAPHSGFGLGFERLMLFVTGMTNIRDVIPFPRTPKSAEF